MWKKYDSIPYINDVEGAGRVSHIVPPKNARSRFAAFDPAKKDSANLMHGIGAAGAMTMTQNKTTPTQKIVQNRSSPVPPNYSDFLNTMKSAQRPQDAPPMVQGTIDRVEDTKSDWLQRTQGYREKMLETLQRPIIGGLLAPSQQYRDSMLETLKRLQR